MGRENGLFSAILKGKLYRRNHLQNSIITIKCILQNTPLICVKQVMMVE